MTCDLDFRQGSVMNLAAYFSRAYLPRLVARGVKAATIADYERVVRSAPTRPTRDSVVSWLASMDAPASTRNNRRRYLLAVLRDARRRGLVGSWIDDIPKAFESSRLPRAWRLDEFERLLEACNRLAEQYSGLDAPLWWRSFLLTSWYTGLRVQSLLRARADALDLTAATLVVHSTKDRRELIYVLPEDAIAAIHAIWGQRQRIWPWPFADQRKTLLRRMRRLIATAELPQLDKPFHAVRRSVASYITAQAGLASACDYLDHCRVEITRRHYVDPRIANTVRHAAHMMPRPK